MVRKKDDWKKGEYALTVAIINPAGTRVEYDVPHVSAKTGAKLSDELLGLIGMKDGVCNMGSHLCPKHGYVHGTEAQELREGLEELIGIHAGDDLSPMALRNLLDVIDARDSLAVCEAKNG